MSITTPTTSRRRFFQTTIQTAAVATLAASVVQGADTKESDSKTAEPVLGMIFPPAHYPVPPEAKLLYPNPLSSDQLKTLHDTLLPGLPDYEWTNEWYAFTTDPTNTTKKAAVNTKLTNLIKYMLELAEYQLM